MAGAAEHVELPIRIHDLFLGMAGRVDDDALSAAREMLAVGELTGAMEMLLGCLVAGRVVTSPREQEHLRDLLTAVNSDPALAGSLKVRDSWLAQQHRFSTDDAPDRGVAAAIRPVLDTLPGIESISCVWRTTPAGAAPCALPQRVVLLELGPEGLPTATSYRVHHALAVAGLPAVVEVLRPGTGRSDYHSRALGEAHGVDRNGGSDRGVSPDRNPGPGGRVDYPGQQAPARSGSAHGRRSGNRLLAEPNPGDEPTPPTGGFERPFGEERPLGRPKPVAKRASVTRIQSRPAEAPRPAESSPAPTPPSARPDSDGAPSAPSASSDDGNGSSGLAGKAQPASAEPSVESDLSSWQALTSVAPESAASTATDLTAVGAPNNGGHPGTQQPGYQQARGSDSTAGHLTGHSGTTSHRQNAGLSGTTGLSGPVELSGPAGLSEYSGEYRDHTPGREADPGHNGRGENPASANGTPGAPVLRALRSVPGRVPGSTPPSGFAMTDVKRPAGFGAAVAGSEPAAAGPVAASVTESSGTPQSGIAPAAAAAMPAAPSGPAPVSGADKVESSGSGTAAAAAAEVAPTGREDATSVGHEPASAHFASTELAGIGPMPAEPGPSAPQAGQDADTATSRPVAVPEQLANRRIPDMPASVAKNLNDKERDLLRQLHEELAQREQRERQDSKRWQLARPPQNRESAPPMSGGTAWPPLAAEETFVNGTPPGGWPGPQS